MSRSLLIGIVTRDWELVSKLARHYHAEKGTPDSIFLGRALKLILMNDIDGAKDSWKRKRPRFEAQFVGSTQCLEAIVNKDQQAFVAALGLASKSWAKVVASSETEVCRTRYVLFRELVLSDWRKKSSEIKFPCLMNIFPRNYFNNGVLLR